MADVNADTTTERWRTVPGLQEFIEAGEPLDDLAEREVFVPPTVRANVRGPELANYVARLRTWLQGYDRDRVLAERVPVWMPLVELWAPPGGSAELNYEGSRERSAKTQISLFGLAGFASASTTTLGESLTFTVDESAPGRVCSVRAFITVTRYVRATDGASFERVDVLNDGELVDLRLDELAPDAFPFAGRSASEAQLREGGYVPRSILRLRDSSGEGFDVYEPRFQTKRNWSAEIGIPDVPLLKAPLKVGASADQSEAFKAKFSLPRGHDYAFFTRSHEFPVVPACARLLDGVSP
jgi:hypothetical protein